MKIEQPVQNNNLVQQQLHELNVIRHQLSDHTNRPCKSCLRPCSCCGSLSCNCDCSLTCSDMPAKLSSDADRFPIERHILPLVFTFNKMNICQTCWSCEGHQNGLGEISKLPQVWFYTDSMILLRLIDNCLSQFKMKKLIAHDWQISVAYSPQSCEQSAFTLKPDSSLLSQPNLMSLQSDAARIAELLPCALDKLNASYIESYTNKVDRGKLNKPTERPHG